MDLYQYLSDKYGYDEPIFMEDLRGDVDFLSSEALRQAMKRMVDKGEICRFKSGIYFIPNPNSVLKTKTLSVNKIINKKYLYNNEQRIGYLTGLSFANSLKLTTQNPGVIEVVTAAEKAAIRIVNYNKRKVALRKPRVEINNDNYKVLQVLDLLTNFDKLSVQPIKTATENILNYLSDVKVTKDQLNQYLNKYPTKTYKNFIESDLYNELTQRQ